MCLWCVPEKLASLHSRSSFVPAFHSLPSPVNWVFRPQSARQPDWWKKLAGKYLPPFATGSRLRRRQGWRRWMSGSSCWRTPTNTLPLIIFIIYMPGAVWCTVTDYHNNDGAQWMATRRKACFFIGMKPACTRSLQKRCRAFMLDLAQLQTQHDQQCQRTDAVTRI